MKIGIIREGKIPPDSRVPLTPIQCAKIMGEYPKLSIIVQPSPIRCFPDSDYRHYSISMQEDVSGCDILMGVKEVPIDQLIADKTYFFFSHTIKKQSHNRDLLRAVLDKNIRLIDYEVLTDERGKRMIAFGKFAGMVGAHNGVMAYGRRTGLFELKRMKECLDYAEANSIYKGMKWPAMRIVLTGTGRVGMGAALVLKDMGIRQVSPEEYLSNQYEEAVFTQLRCQDYAARKDGKPFNNKDFYANPGRYKSIFAPFATKSDIMINGIYWDNEAPAFFTIEEMKQESFAIQVIADVTCDIAPLSSIPSTIKASTITRPVFGFDPDTATEAPPYQEDTIDMMTIDNLPNELPRDASKAFGKQFYTFILPELLKPESEVIRRATIAEAGRLGPEFTYLEGYVKGEE